MAADEKWYFSKTQLANTPSRRCGLDADKELSYRQQAANFIQDMGQRLKVTQLCINTAIVYMHRFYIFHSFSQFHRNSMALASLFLAAKVEEQPRKLEHVITVSHWCLYREEPKLDTKSEQYMEQAQELVFNENVLLQTLGFDVAIDHPHTHVVRCCHLVRANKELAQTSYFMASNSLHLTTMCLQYKPTVVACFCIHLACKWSSWEIPQSNEGKDWFTYIDPSVSLEQLEQLTAEFLAIYDKCPSRLKKMSGKKDDSFGLMGHNMSGPQMDQEPRKVRPTFPSVRPSQPVGPQDGSSGSASLSVRPEDSKKPHPSRVDYRDYKEKKAREAAAAAAGTSSKDVKHPTATQQAKPPPPPAPNHHLAKREAAKREMMARESAAAKREALKQEVGGRIPRPTDVPNPHHVSQDSRDPKRPRDVLDNIAGSSSSQAQLLPDPSSLQQKNHHGSLDPNNVSNRRSREPSDLPTHHHHHHGYHHGDNPKRDVQRPSPSPSSNHHPSTNSSNSMKRPRDNHDPASLGQPISQPKRPREGADPMANVLDPSKRPREPTDSNHSFGSIKSDSSVQSSSSESSQHGERHHHVDLKQSSTSMKYLQDSKPQQHPTVTGFVDSRQSSKGLPPSNSANMPSRHFNHRHSRPQDGVAKNYEPDQQIRSKLPLDKRDSPLVPKPQDTHSLRPNQQSMVGKSPTSAMSRPKSPSEYLNKPSESRSRSPKPISTPSDVSKRTADILSRPSGHLFSPEDDREDSTLPSLESDSQFQSLLMDSAPTSQTDSGYRSRDSASAEPPFIKSEKPSPTMKSKLRGTPEKNRDNSLVPHMFALPPSPNSQVMQGKAGLPTTPTTPTSENRKRRRTQSSSSSEPELVPLIRKLEDIPGFHGIIKDKEVGIKLPGRVPDMIQPIRDHSLPSTPGKDTPISSSSLVKQEVPTNGSIKHEAPGNDFKSLSDSTGKDINQFVNIPTLVEPFRVKHEVSEPVAQLSPLLPNLADVPPTPGAEKNIELLRAAEESIATGSGEHHRKKKKEKHGKKDKDKDRNREERKHKHKKKDKDKDKNREEKSNSHSASGSAPIKITITKDKLSNVSSQDTSKRSPLTQDGTSVLKIKIPKERLKVESSQIASSTSTSSSMPMGGLKIKIGKEVISERRLESTPEQNSRKRSTNDASSSSKTPATQQPSRRNYNKQNGHPDKKVPLKVDSGSLHPSPGWRQ